MENANVKWDILGHFQTMCWGQTRPTIEVRVPVGKVCKLGWKSGGCIKVHLPEEVKQEEWVVVTSWKFAWGNEHLN